jgi:hypothetical protein
MFLPLLTSNHHRAPDGNGKRLSCNNRCISQACRYSAISIEMRWPFDYQFTPWGSGSLTGRLAFTFPFCPGFRSSALRILSMSSGFIPIWIISRFSKYVWRIRVHSTIIHMIDANPRNENIDPKRTIGIRFVEVTGLLAACAKSVSIWTPLKLIVGERIRTGFYIGSSVNQVSRNRQSVKSPGPTRKCSCGWLTMRYFVQAVFESAACQHADLLRFPH